MEGQERKHHIIPLPLIEPYKIADAPVVGFFAVLGKEAARDLAGFAVISHALAAHSALGTTIGAGAIFGIFFFHAFHGSFLILSVGCVNHTLFAPMMKSVHFMHPTSLKS